MTIAIPASRTGDGLRPINLAHDLPQVVSLLKLVFGESLDSADRYMFSEGSSGAVNELLYRLQPSASRLASGYVWQIDGRIVGNATLLSTRNWERYLVANVAVHPEYRRQGIARGMMQAIAGTVKSRGGRVILLQVVKDNFSAVNLYRSLGYTAVGNMASWYGPAGRIRQIHPDTQAQPAPAIDLLPGNRWQDAYKLDRSHLLADLNWPEPISPDAYRRTWWQKTADFFNGRQFESWVTADSSDELTGLVSILSEWGRSHVLSLRVRPDFAGRLERPLLAKALRRLTYLPRRNVRIDHPEADETTMKLLQESNFTVQRTLTHMRLDLTG